VRARIADLLPATVVDRPGWAIDIYAAFDACALSQAMATFARCLPSRSKSPPIAPTPLCANVHPAGIAT